LWYRAPEILYNSKEYTTAIDIWSAGCIFGELLTSKPLLPGKSELEQLNLIVELLGSPSEKIWPGFDDLPCSKLFKIPRVIYDSVSSRFPNEQESTKHLLKDMLTYWPKARITAGEALESEYFYTAPRACDPLLLPSYPELRNSNNAPVIQNNQQQEPVQKFKTNELLDLNAQESYSRFQRD
jgi:cyclin-dependent kinase 10